MDTAYTPGSSVSNIRSTSLGADQARITRSRDREREGKVRSGQGPRRETLESPERRCRIARSTAPVVRAAVPADAEPVAVIFAHYVATSVATFEEVAPTAADWRQRLGDLAGRNLPFLVAEANGVEGAVCGFAYASPWRPKPAYRRTDEGHRVPLPRPYRQRDRQRPARRAAGRVRDGGRAPGGARSSPTPAATRRPRCTAGSASPGQAFCSASAASTAAGSTRC